VNVFCMWDRHGIGRGEHKRIDYCGLNCGPPKHRTMFQPSEPQNVTLFGIKVFADLYLYIKVTISR